MPGVIKPKPRVHQDSHLQCSISITTATDVIDFKLHLLCTLGFKVIANVAIDTSSHQGKFMEEIMAFDIILLLLLPLLSSDTQDMLRSMLSQLGTMRL